MKNLYNIARKILIPGCGWFPLLVFITHLFLIRLPHLYARWPHADMPIHFLGRDCTHAHPLPPASRRDKRIARDHLRLGPRG